MDRMSRLCVAGIYKIISGLAVKATTNHLTTLFKDGNIMLQCNTLFLFSMITNYMTLLLNVFHQFHRIVVF